MMYIARYLGNGKYLRVIWAILTTQW